MAMMDSNGWNGQDHGLHGGPDDDFHQFLDMNGMANLGDGLQFDFQDFQTQNGGHMMQVAHRETMDTPMSGTDGPMLLSNAMHNQMPPMTTAPPHSHSHSTIPSTMIQPPPTPGEAISELDAQIQYLQQQKFQQQQRQLDEQQIAFFTRQNHMVPPTPQSLELQAGNNRFYAHQQDQTPQQHQDMYERFQRMKEQQDMSFTPLVSPAVTPLDTQFPIDQPFTVPGAYFSPLTSPALHAQNDSMSVVFDQGMSGMNNSSPGEMDLEALPAPAPAPVPAPNPTADLAKKVRRSNAAKARAKSSVGKSPITKPQRKKTGSTPLMNAQVLSELAETAEQAKEPRTKARTQTQTGPASQASNSSTAGITDSEYDSVSPEALSDMPPPPLPKPRSAKPSPYIQPQSSATPTMGPSIVARTGKPSPATPASLMKLASPNANKANASGESDPLAAENIESFELPESVNGASFQKSQLAPINTKSPQIQSPASEPKPGRATAFQPLPSPVSTNPRAAASASQSPQLTPGSSMLTPNSRRTPQLAPRGNKKRASISSSHASPALLPRISPNIKPLLPGGSRAEDTASLLLTSKSNYQNILEGNTVPGVSYPSELSTNLTSKRTSHKIAEQGRRNRINSALQEIATLLPTGTIIEGKDSGGELSDKKDPKTGATPNSKASTVEMAIEYIKQLKKEVEEANKRAEEAENQLRIKETA